MTDLLVTIGTYASALDAHLVKARLEAAGIEAFVTSSELGGTPGGGVELRVRTSASEDALAVLGARAGPKGKSGYRERASTAATPDAVDASGDEAERCLICQSSSVTRKEPPLLVRVLLGAAIEVLPLPRSWLWRPRLVCGVCGHEWRPGHGSAPLEPR